MKNQYTTVVENGMRVKHTAKARFIVKSGNLVLEDSLTPVEVLGGAMTRAGIMYNRLSYSGGVSWWNPATGYEISRPKVTFKVRPQDVLTGDQECDCERCVE